MDGLSFVGSLHLIPDFQLHEDQGFLFVLLKTSINLILRNNINLSLAKNSWIRSSVKFVLLFFIICDTRHHKIHKSFLVCSPVVGCKVREKEKSLHKAKPLTLYRARGYFKFTVNSLLSQCPVSARTGRLLLVYVHWGSRSFLHRTIRMLSFGWKLTFRSWW